jgi:hypothetical protein
MMQLLVQDVYLLPEADAMNTVPTRADVYLPVRVDAIHRFLQGRDTAYVAGNGSVHVARAGYALTMKQKRLMIII